MLHDPAESPAGHGRPRAPEEYVMKKNIVYVDAALLQAVCDALGLRLEDQKGFVKVHLGPKGRYMYIGRTARVGRVDISGFEVDTEEFAHVKDLGGDSFGGVKQQIDFEAVEGRTVESLVATFRAVAEYGMGLADAEPKPKKAPGATTAGPKPEGWSNSPAARLERVLKTGMKPGPRLIAEVRAACEAAGTPIPEACLTDAELEALTARLLHGTVEDGTVEDDAVEDDAVEVVAANG